MSKSSGRLPPPSIDLGGTGLSLDLFPPESPITIS
jgi:hypothetical protein